MIEPVVTSGACPAAAPHNENAATSNPTPMRTNRRKYALILTTMKTLHQTISFEISVNGFTASS